MSKLEAIIFDLDDTLYLEETYVRSGFQAVANYVASRCNHPASEGSRELIDIFHRGVRGNTFNVWVKQIGIPASVESLVQVYRNHKPHIEPFDWVVNLLQQLSNRFKLALISDGHLDVQKRKLAALNIEKYFDVIVFSDEFGIENWKPALRPFEEALRRLQISATQAVYVGDNPGKDFLPARRVGMKSIRIRHENGIYNQLKPESPESAPDIVVEDASELHDTLKALNVP